jgi:MraZ protein
MFYGEYYNKIDDKGRLRMPPKLKDELGSRYLVTKGGNGCLFVFSAKTAEKLEEKLNAVPMTDLEAQKPLRMLFAGGFMVEEDAQGRLLLPPKLREFAGLSGEAAVIGAGTRIEIWNGEKWKAYSEAADFDTALAGLAKFGI